MALQPDDRIEVFQQFSGIYTPPQIPVLEAANSTWVMGDVLFMSYGYPALCGANPGQVYGTASQNAHNDPVIGHSSNAVTLITPQTIFSANMKSNLANYVILQTDIGSSFGIQRDPTSHFWFIDTSTRGGGPNVRVFVHATALGSAIGDTNARVLFTFLERYIQFYASS